MASTDWPGKQTKAWAVPSGGDPVYVDTSDDHGRAAPPLPAAQAFVQWKGTAVCLDFHCACGADGHVDREWFAYSLECSACGRVFAMPHTVELLEQAP